MLRKLVIVGLVAGGSASVPVLYQANPELFEGAVKAALEEPEPEPEAQRPLVVIQQAKTEAPRQALSGRKVRLTLDGKGHFNGEFRLNGRPVEALVDTGATMVALNVSTARRIGISLMPSDFVHRVNTANGEIRGAIARIDNVQIGRIQVKDVEAMVLEDRALSDILVGMTFLNRLASFRMENGTLLLEQ